MTEVLVTLSFATALTFVFVAMDADRKPTPVPALEVTTDADKQAWEIAKTVREQSLKIKSLE